MAWRGIVFEAINLLFNVSFVETNVEESIVGLNEGKEYCGGCLLSCLGLERNMKKRTGLRGIH